MQDRQADPQLVGASDSLAGSAQVVMGVLYLAEDASADESLSSWSAPTWPTIWPFGPACAARSNLDGAGGICTRQVARRRLESSRTDCRFIKGVCDSTFRYNAGGGRAWS
jgi:hypothetical protein